MPQVEREELARHGRRWADVAWIQGWYAHAIEVLDRAIEINPDNFKLYRKRGAFCLMCPDDKIRDEEQGIADLRRACELSGWRDDLVRWAAELLNQCGEVGPAKDLMRELARRNRRPAGGKS